MPGESTAQTTRGTHVSGPTHPEYAAPPPPEASDLPYAAPQQPRKNGGAGMIAVLATVSLPVLMWLVGRNRRHA
jgi:hypothetical protein